MGRFLCIPAELVAPAAQPALDDSGDKWSRLQNNFKVLTIVVFSPDLC